MGCRHTPLCAQRCSSGSNNFLRMHSRSHNRHGRTERWRVLQPQTICQTQQMKLQAKDVPSAPLMSPSKSYQSMLTTRGNKRESFFQTASAAT